MYPIKPSVKGGLAHMGDYGWGCGMGIGMLLFWGLLIVGIVMLGLLWLRRLQEA